MAQETTHRQNLKAKPLIWMAAANYTLKKAASMAIYTDTSPLDIFGRQEES